MVPPNCPSGALSWDDPLNSAWLGGTSLPKADWIWRPDVGPGSPAALKVAIFEKKVVVGPGATGTIQLAADDMAIVFVNGFSVGSVGSIADMNVAWRANNTSTTLDLTPALRDGSNTITVADENGPFCSPSSCTYTQNPAGVVFEVSLRW
jgi:hypothetical protein